MSASFGCLSAHSLAGIHNGRLHSFIAHDGIYDTRSMAGTTEELRVTTYEFGGNDWEKNNMLVQKSVTGVRHVIMVHK